MRRRLLVVIVLLCGSPAIAGSVRNSRLYDHVVKLRAADPDRFDGNYPFIGKLLRDDKFFDKLYDRWQANPARFEHYHDPLLIRILDGKPRVPPPLSPIHPPRPPHFPPILPPDECGPNSPGAVPEPGTLAIMLIGMGTVLLWRRSR